MWSTRQNTELARRSAAAGRRLRVVEMRACGALVLDDGQVIA